MWNKITIMDEIKIANLSYLRVHKYVESMTTEFYDSFNSIFIIKLQLRQSKT